MRKIMFQEKFGLESAVFERSKTMTRRVARYRGKQEVCYYRWPAGKVVGDGQYLFIECLDADERSFEPEQYIRSQYHVGEIVAIAQPYKDIHQYGTVPTWVPSPKDPTGFVMWDESAGYNNKLYVCADFMPHHIKITGIKAEFMQDISEEDAMKEGIIRVDETSRVMGCKPYYTYYGSKFHGETAKAAFISLIDKLRKKPKTNINGREIPCEPYNPIVFVYEFEFVD